MSSATLIFDFDGTLHDSMYIYSRAFPAGYQALVDAGKARPRNFTQRELEANIGLTAKEAWCKLAPDIPWYIAREGAAVVGSEMLRLMNDGTARLFPGVTAMLDTLLATGHVMVFLSNCSTDYQQTARKSFGLDRWFSAYHNAEQHDWAPKEQMFTTIQRSFEGPFIAIGDRYKDISLADAYHLPSIGCTYGYGTFEELSPATYLADSPHEIAELIARIEQDNSALNVNNC